MNENLPYWESDPIGFLIDRLFPDQRTFANPEYWEQFPEHKQRYETAKEAGDRFIESLSSLSAEQISHLLESEKQKEIDERIEIVSNMDRTRFFNDSYAQTDWDHWSKISYWTAEEAVAISFGKDPRIVNLTRIQPYEGNSIFVANFHSQLQLVTRAIETGQLMERNTPPYFLAWASRTNFLMHPMAFETVQALGNQIADWKTEYDNLSAFLESLLTEHDQTKAEVARSQAELQSIYHAAYELAQDNERLEARVQELEAAQIGPKPDVTPRERKSMLTMILAMAMRKYQFDPSKAKNSATGNIAGAIEQIGLQLDDDTVRKFLNEARVLLTQGAE